MTRLNLETIRQEIDQIDQDLVSLLEKRMNLVGQVAAYKKASAKPVLDKAREATLLQKVGDTVKHEEYRECIQATFQSIMDHSRAYQVTQLGRDHES